MKRTLDQNALFHVFCGQISDHLISSGVKRVSPAMVKELIKMLLGNTTELMSTKIAMPTSSYKRSDEDLTQQEIDNGVISMTGLIDSMTVWAATDLNLELISPNERGDL